MKKLLIMLLLFGLFSCKTQSLETVKVLEINKYAGTWFEIARLPNRFEKDLECVTATYELMENGKIKVINRGISVKDHSKKKEITGKAWIPDDEFPGRLKVQFFWPFSGNYWVIELDTNYRFALVGDPSRKYLWILSKDKQLDKTIYQKMINTAKETGFKTEHLLLVNQDCE